MAADGCGRVLVLGVSRIDFHVVPAEFVRFEVVVGLTDGPVSTKDLAFVKHGDRRVDSYPERVEWRKQPGQAVCPGRFLDDMFDNHVDAGTGESWYGSVKAIEEPFPPFPSRFFIARPEAGVRELVRSVIAKRGIEFFPEGLRQRRFARAAGSVQKYDSTAHNNPRYVGIRYGTVPNAPLRIRRRGEATTD